MSFLGFERKYGCKSSGGFGIIGWHIGRFRYYIYNPPLYGKRWKFIYGCQNSLNDGFTYHPREPIPFLYLSLGRLLISLERTNIERILWNVWLKKRCMG